MKYTENKLCTKLVSFTRQFFSVDERSIYYVFLSLNKQFSFRPLFLDVMMFSVSTIPPTQKTTKLSVAKLQAKQESNNH